MSKDSDSLAGIVSQYQGYAATRRRFLDTIDCGTSCRDPLSEFSEVLAAKLLNARKAESRVQKGYDLIRKTEQGQRFVQVKYLCNPADKWVNEHDIRFTPGVDAYALVVFVALRLQAVIVFPAESIEAICKLLGKRHADQDKRLLLTQRNFEVLLSERARFEQEGVEIFTAEDIDTIAA